MIDLHLHFDGSLPVKTVWEQAKKQGITLAASSMDELLFCLLPHGLYRKRTIKM